MHNKFLMAICMGLLGLLFSKPALVSGNVLTPEVQISQNLSPDMDRFLPAVAYNSNRREYLVAWHQWAIGSRQVYTRMVSHDGTPLGYPNRITAAEWRDNFQPAVAYNATNDQYLVVWMVDADPQLPNKRYEIWGQILHPNNEPVASVFLIFSWPNRWFWTPKVVWNSQQNSFFVVWNAFDATTELPTDVAGIRVSSNGVPDAAAQIITTSGSPHQANLAYNAKANNFLAVWRHKWTVIDWDIYGRILDASGIPFGDEFVINQEKVDSQSPSVAGSGDHYFVVWQHASSLSGTHWNIAGRVLRSNGVPLIDSFPIAISPFTSMMPCVVASRNAREEFLTVFQQGTETGIAVRARLDGMAGDNLNAALEQFEVAPGNFYQNTNPAAASAPDGYFMAYEGDSTGDPTVYQYIYGRAWVLSSVFLPLILR